MRVSLSLIPPLLLLRLPSVGWLDAPHSLDNGGERGLADPVEVKWLSCPTTLCSICHTDLAVQSGAFPSPFPNVTGHEGSGVVLKAGKSVTRVKEGDKVLCSFNHCSQCGPCQVRPVSLLSHHTFC